mmetsp:Transcript_30272/g.72938  ORF Transcript_30272/g.72938 Transcript_30272/m.72938 type:complete len:213 (+) Transcript_30272:639-1277(+)
MCPPVEEEPTGQADIVAIGDDESLLAKAAQIHAQGLVRQLLAARRSVWLRNIFRHLEFVLHFHSSSRRTSIFDRRGSLLSLHFCCLPIKFELKSCLSSELLHDFLCAKNIEVHVLEQAVVGLLGSGSLRWGERRLQSLQGELFTHLTLLCRLSAELIGELITHLALMRSEVGECIRDLREVSGCQSSLLRCVRRGGCSEVLHCCLSALHQLP